MAKHNTQPGRFHRIFVPIPANVAVLRGLLGPLPVGGLTASTGCLPSGGTASPVWPVGASDLAACSWGFALPTRAPPGIELWSFRLCAPPVYRVVMEFKPSPFSFLLSPFLVQSLQLFPLSTFLQLHLGWGVFFPYSLPHPTLSQSSLHVQKGLPALQSSPSPSSPLHAVYLLISVAQVMQIVVLILRSLF